MKSRFDLERNILIGLLRAFDINGGNRSRRKVGRLGSAEVRKVLLKNFKSTIESIRILTDALAKELSSTGLAGKNFSHVRIFRQIEEKFLFSKLFFDND